MTKSPRQKWLLILVIILLLTNITTLSIFWFVKPKKATPQDRQRMGTWIVNELKLDKDQETAYWKLRDSLISQQKPIMDSMRAAKKRFFEQLNNPNVNDSLLDATSNKTLALQKRLDFLTFQHFQQVRTLCRAEQLPKLDTVVKEIINRMTTPRRSNANSQSD
jgi:periplasmic protein CpxP/Spy